MRILPLSEITSITFFAQNSCLSHTIGNSPQVASDTDSKANPQASADHERGGFATAADVILIRFEPERRSGPRIKATFNNSPRARPNPPSHLPSTRRERRRDIRLRQRFRLCAQLRQLRQVHTFICQIDFPVLFALGAAHSHGREAQLAYFKKPSAAG